MKILSYTRLVFITVILLVSHKLSAQNYTGIWQGYITASEGGVQYYNSGYAINIKTHESGIITGTSYLYGRYTLKFEGLLDFIGTVSNEKNKSAVTELKILRYKTSNDTFKLCIKLADMDFTHKNGVDYLTGNWNGDTQDGNTCAPGKVYLQRYNPKAPAGIEPIPDEVMKMIADEKSQKMQFLGTELLDPIVISVNNSTIHFQIEDYMREDLDTVSVYLNRKTLMSRVLITKKPKNFTAHLDKRSELSEIIMYAENLGKVPPNTSTLTIIDGRRRHKVSILATKEKSAVIYLRYTDKKSLDMPRDKSGSDIVNRL
jgi:hypothetical protein